MTDTPESPSKKTSIDTRFPSGKSGNPKGRPKGSKNRSTIFEKVADTPVVANKNGRRAVMTRVEALFEQVANKAAAGDLKAAKIFLELYDRYYKRDICNSPMSQQTHSSMKLLSDEEVAKQYLEALKKAKSDD
jgi:hypothetical protein